MNPIRPLALVVGLTLAGSAGALETLHSTVDVKQLSAQTGPCANLYDYVNGEWAKTAHIPADRTTWGSFEQLDERSLAATRELVEAAAQDVAKAAPGSIGQKIGRFYASGMDGAAINKAGIAPLADTLKRIDGLKTPDEIVAFVQDSHAAGTPLLFQFGAQSDFKNSSLSIGYAFQGGLGLPERGYYTEDGKDGTNKKIREAYVAHVARMLELGGAKKGGAEAQAKAVLAFETRLATASLSRIELRKPDNQYHYVSVAEAEKATPNFSWRKFFATQSAAIDDGFSLSQPKFFAEMDKMLADVSAADWRAYLRFHVLRGAAPYLSDPFVDESFAFYGKTLRGQQELKPRWKRALESVEDGMGMALGELYVAKYFPPEAKQRAQQLVDNLRAVTKTRLEKLEWMSMETKKQALEKWASFTPKIGYPDQWRDWSGLVVVEGDYFTNVRAAAKFDHDYDVAKIGKPVDRKEWGMTPQTVNAYYNPTKNEIVFPAAILQPPFFDANADDALNYGGIGAVIGHEMMHGYDDQGSQFDAKGNLQSWWTKDDREKFDGRTARLVQQFDDYVAIDDLHVKGPLTLGENIADLGGLDVSYDALQTALAKNPQKSDGKIDGFTPDQRFFLNWAKVWRRAFRPEELKLRLNTDPHAPAMFRAIGAPSNLPMFAEAFGCKAGDGMIRPDDKRVKIW